MEPLAALTDRCRVCDHPYSEGERWCWNLVCRLRPDDRWFDWNFAIAMRTKWLKSAINWYKYDGQRHWATIFGRILTGFLETEGATFAEVDLIVASPVFVSAAGRRKWDHIRPIIVAADKEQEIPWMNRWDFDLADAPALIKTAETPSMVGLNAAARRKMAESDLRKALVVPDRSRTEGKVIAVFDDIFTGGWTLREEARALKLQGGASTVVGVTLARQGYTAPA
jgi:predicted amidophosphoribosyltransferase